VRPSPLIEYRHWNDLAGLTSYTHTALPTYAIKQSIDHFTRCKQHWSRSTSCFSFL